MKILTLALLFLSAAAEAAAPKPPVLSDKKLNPGHYVALTGQNDTTAGMASLKVPGVRGFLKRYTWRELEPSLGVYNLTEVATDLAWAKANNVMFIVFVEDKSFSSSRPTPDYILTAPTKTGYTAVRWDPYVSSRMKALLRQFARFDSHAAFEGVALQETAPSMYDADLTAYGYTPEKYRDMYIDVLRSTSKALVKSRVFWHMNFLPGNQSYLGQIAEAVAPYGVVMGGPDLLPDSASLNRHAYPLYPKFASKMPLFTSAQYDSYRHEHLVPSATKYWTMQELYDWGKANLHISYMMWTATKFANPPDSYTWYDAVPVIKAN